MPANIFINYRKDDSRWNTQALYNELLKYFPKDSIFKDFNTIGLGDDYVVSINNALEQCDVLLVIIGKNWLGIKNAQGILRLTDPADLVRIEIATALRRNIKVIPVMFDNVDMFAAQDLPEELQPLVRRQHLTVSDTKFESDVQRLAAEIKKILDAGDSKKTQPVTSNDVQAAAISPSHRWRTAWMVGLIGALLTVISCFLLFSNDQRFIMQGGAHLVKYSLGSGGFAGLLWIVVGAVAGPRKKLLQAVVAGAFIALIAWIAVYGTYQDTVWAAFVFGMPIGALLGILIARLARKSIGNNS